MPTPTDLRRQSHNGPRTNFMPTPTNLKRSQSHNGPRNDFMLLSARLGSPAVALIASISLFTTLVPRTNVNRSQSHKRPRSDFMPTPTDLTASERHHWSWCQAPLIPRDQKGWKYLFCRGLVVGERLLGSHNGAQNDFMPTPTNRIFKEEQLIWSQMLLGTFVRPKHRCQ